MPLKHYWRINPDLEAQRIHKNWLNKEEQGPDVPGCVKNVGVKESIKYSAKCRE